MSKGDGGAAAALFQGMSEVTGVLTADLGGNVLEATPRPPELGAQQAASSAVVLRELTSIGKALTLGPLELLLTHGPHAVSVTALKRGAFLFATVDPSRGTAQVEQALKAWTPPAPTPAPAPAASPSPPVLHPTPPPIPAVPAAARPAAGPPPAQTAAFSGRLSVFALPDLLEFLRSGRRSGVLVCRSEAGSAALRFRDGLITGSRSTAALELGSVLVKARKIAPKDLETPPARQAAALGPEALGDMLVRAGLVDALTVQKELARHIERTVRTLIGWRDGQFAFDNHGTAAAATTSVPVALDCQAVLLNAFKELDESTRGPGSSTAL